MEKAQKQILFDAAAKPQALTEWELNFVTGLHAKPDSITLSEKQVEIFNRIKTKIDKK